MWGASVLSKENQEIRNRRFMRAFALLREPCGQQGRSVFSGVAARLKPCPDTCMVDGCDVAVRADVGVC
jgi:hypothetical protein